MNYDIVTIGSAVLDVHLKSDTFTVAAVRHQLMVCEIYGGKMDVEAASISSGGAATNTAVSFARQGFVVGCVAELGVDIAAQVIWDDLHQDGVHTRLLIQEENERSGISVLLVAADGSRSAMTYRGAARRLRIDDVPFAKLEHVRAIHLSTVGDIQVVKKVGEFCREHKIFFSWNPSKLEAEELFLKQHLDPRFCDILFLNDLEFEAVERAKVSVLAATKILVVTRGPKGGEIYVEGQKRGYEAKPVKVVCATGAGDAFAAGFVGAHLRGEPLEETIKFAVENASSVVGYMGAKEGLLKVSLK